MLNRTNRTLSATTNRLNLGTRTLGHLVASDNNGTLTLRAARPFLEQSSCAPAIVEVSGHSDGGGKADRRRCTQIH